MVTERSTVNTLSSLKRERIEKDFSQRLDFVDLG